MHQRAQKKYQIWPSPLGLFLMTKTPLHSFVCQIYKRQCICLCVSIWASQNAEKRSLWCFLWELFKKWIFGYIVSSDRVGQTSVGFAVKRKFFSFEVVWPTNKNHSKIYCTSSFSWWYTSSRFEATISVYSNLDRYFWGTKSVHHWQSCYKISNRDRVLTEFDNTTMIPRWEVNSFSRCANSPQINWYVVVTTEYPL